MALEMEGTSLQNVPSISGKAGNGAPPSLPWEWHLEPCHAVGKADLDQIDPSESNGMVS